MDRVFEELVGHGMRRALAPVGFTVDLQHRTSLDHEKRIGIRPDIVVRKGAEIVAVADLKNKRTGAISPGDVYQAIGYATRFDLPEVALIYPEPPPYNELTVSAVRVHLLCVDISLPPAEREQAIIHTATQLVAAYRS